MNNGPSRELRSADDFETEMVYCVDCGNVFVWAEGRDCPACHVDDRLDQLEGDDD